MSTAMANSNSNPQNGGGLDASTVGADNLSNQLAGLSKHQLYQIVSQMKDLIHQNQQQARQILIANPQLTKALFQAQIMLGMVRAPDTPPLASPRPQAPQSASAPSQASQQLPTQTQTPQAPPALPPHATTVSQPLTNQPVPSQQPLTNQPVPSQQPTSQQGPPQMSSPSYMQQSQAPNMVVQPIQTSFPFQQPVQPPQQSQSRTNSMLPQSQPLPASTSPPTLQHGLPPQPPVPLHPPPLPQQPRPVGPSSQGLPPQMQHQNTQGIGFPSHPVPQSYHPQPAYLQQGGPPQANAGVPFQMHPPLPNQPMPQHMLQVPRNTNANYGQGAIFPVGPQEPGRGPSMGVPNVSASVTSWNQPLQSSAPISAPQATPMGVGSHMAPGHHAFGVGGPASQVFNQPLAQPQPQQQIHPSQMPVELEQQKALLQQVMNLTPEQINSLPPEQRQQVLQLQQAFRNQTG